MSHAPTPWEVDDAVYVAAHADTDDRVIVADCYQHSRHDIENAAHIVKAVNMHDALVGFVEGSLLYFAAGPVHERAKALLAEAAK